SGASVAERLMEVDDVTREELSAERHKDAASSLCESCKTLGKAVGECLIDVEWDRYLSVHLEPGRPGPGARLGGRALGPRESRPPVFEVAHCEAMRAGRPRSQVPGYTPMWS